MFPYLIPAKNNQTLERMPTSDNNPLQVRPKVARSPGTSRDLIGLETPPKAKSGLPTEDALSGMTDFQKLGVYLNFLEGGKRNYQLSQSEYDCRN